MVHMSLAEFNMLPISMEQHSREQVFSRIVL